MKCADKAPVFQDKDESSVSGSISATKGAGRLDGEGVGELAIERHLAKIE